jgi:hypothetical protein
MFKISVRGINNAIFYYITQSEIRAELRGWGVVLGRIPCFFFDPALKSWVFCWSERFLKKQVDKTGKYYILPTSTSAAMLCKMANYKVSLVRVFDL